MPFGSMPRDHECGTPSCGLRSSPLAGDEQGCVCGPDWSRPLAPGCRSARLGLGLAIAPVPFLIGLRYVPPGTLTRPLALRGIPRPPRPGDASRSLGGPPTGRRKTMGSPKDSSGSNSCERAALDRIAPSWEGLWSWEPEECSLAMAQRFKPSGRWSRGFA